MQTWGDLTSLIESGAATTYFSQIMTIQPRDRAKQ
jgi:hypothetical protein